MALPTDSEKLVLIAVLRTLDRSQEEVASSLHIRKGTVVATEKWLKEQDSLRELEEIFQDAAINEAVMRELAVLEEVDRSVLVRAAKVTSDAILRHYRPDYLGQVKQKQTPATYGKGNLQLRVDMPGYAIYIDNIEGNQANISVTGTVNERAVAAVVNALRLGLSPEEIASMLTTKNYPQQVLKALAKALANAYQEVSKDLHLPTT